MKATHIKHDNDNLPKASCDLHQIEKEQYIHLQDVPNHLVKILQTNCFATFGSSACLARNAFPDVCSSLIVPVFKN